MIWTDVEDEGSVDVIVLCFGIFQSGCDIALFYKTGNWWIYLTIRRNKKLNTEIHSVLERGLQEQRWVWGEIEKYNFPKLLPKIMDSAAVLSLLGNTNALSATVFLPTTGRVIRRENKIINTELSSGLCFPRWKTGTLSGLVADLYPNIQLSEICQDLGLFLLILKSH